MMLRAEKIISEGNLKKNIAKENNGKTHKEKKKKERKGKGRREIPPAGPDQGPVQGQAIGCDFRIPFWIDPDNGRDNSRN